MSDLFVGGEFDALKVTIDDWATDMIDTGEGMADVERGTVDNVPGGDPLWVVRLAGDAKDTITIWCVLRQRTLTFDCFVMPAPHGDPARLWEYLLRRNLGLVGAQYAVTAERATHLRATLSDRAISPGELDRVIGTFYDAVEHDFEQILRLGFGATN